MAENSEKQEPSWPPIDQRERTLYEILFYSQGPVDGYLLGDSIRDLFLKSGLPLTVLSQIWNLADVSNDNVLNVHEFVLVMHLITGVIKGLPVPKTLPRNLTPPKTAPVILPDMSPQEKYAYSLVFQSFDAKNKGSIDVSIATEIFRASQLSDDVLIQIWDLADFGRDGKLSLEEFSIACHLLRHVKEGGQLTGPVDIFRYAPGSIAQQSLRARKKRVAEYEDHKQKLMLMKEKRKCQVDRETRRLNLAKSKVQVFQELYDLLVSLETEIKTVEDIQQTIAKESDNIQRQEEIVDRVKKDHEKVRQETVKIILGEQKFNNDISIIKRDTDELNKRLLAVRTPATKDPDPFHQLYEQRKEKRQGSTIKDLDKIEIQVPFGFSPFDIDTLLHSKAMSWATGDNSAVQSPENVKNLLLNLHEFGEQFLATWSQELVVNTDKTQSDEDQIFQEIYDCTDVNWPDWDWSTDGLLGLTNDQVSQLKLKLTDLRETIQKLNSEAGRLVFRNPEDYTARQRAREQEEKTEKSRVPRRSITDRLRAGIKGAGRTKDASKRYSYAGERSISLDTPEVARAAREYRLNRRSQIVDNNDFQEHETLREQRHEEKQPSSKDDSVTIPNISNPDTSTLTLKTSRRKDDLSLDLASIALGRRIQVEEIPVPVSSEWNKKSEQTIPDQRTNILSRSKSEDISLTTSASYELSLGNRPPSIPETPVRSSKKVRAPEPPAITASSTAFVNSTVTSEKNPDIFTSADPSSTDSTNQIISQNNVRVTKADRNSAADVESKNSKASSDSFSVPQRPPRLKKRLGSSETSLELPSPESPPVLNSYSAFQGLIDSLDSEPSKHEKSLTIPEINHLEHIVTPKEDSNTNVDIIQICSDTNTAAQEETIITKFTSNVPNTHETLSLESDQPFEISIQEARQYPDSNPITSTDLEVLDDSVDVTMSMVQIRVEAKLPSNAQLLDSDDEAPPPLPTSPPPLPSSAPPPLPLSTAEAPLIDVSLLDQEETLIITEYTIPLTLTEQQRREFKGHNSTTYSVKEHELSDFDPLSTYTFSEKNNFSVPDASNIPAKTGDIFQSFDPLLDFTETTDVNANKPNQFSNNLININSSDDLDDYVRNGSETLSPGDSGHLTFSLSSTSESDGGNGRGSPGSSDRKSPARSADSPESGFHETIFSSSSSNLSSKPPSMYDQDVRAHNKKPNIAPQPQNSDSSAFVKQENGSQNLKKSPSGEWGAMSPKGKELVDKAKHFADMVQPKVVVRREKESSVEGDFSQDTLQSLELQRRAIISQSVVKRKPNVVLSPSADLDNKLFQDSIQSQSKGPKSANPSEYGYTYIEERPAPPPEVGWVDKPADKINLYSENVIKEGDTTEEINRESIANLSSTKQQWENVFKSQETNPSDTSTLKRKSTPKWEVRLPYKEKPSAPLVPEQEQQETGEIKMSSKSVAETESAIEREIRLAHEREEMLRREKELRLKAASAEKPKSQGQTIIASFEAQSAESESYHPAYNELTEADRGPDLWGVGANNRHNVEDDEDEGDQEKFDINPNESIIEREIRLQREREEEIAKMRKKQGIVISKSQEAPTQVKAQHVVQEQLADVNHNHKAELSYEENSPQDTETLIAKELRELREREEEIRKMHSSFQGTHINDESDSQVSCQKPSTLGLAKSSQPSHGSPSPGQGTWQRDVSPFLSQKRRESQDSNSSHSTGRTPSESTPALRNIKVQPLADDSKEENKPNYFKKQETPIEREMRLARERENELRRQKGLPELKFNEDDFYSSYSHGTENGTSNSSSKPSSHAQPSDSMKKFASNRLQQELMQQKERELALRSEGKIISTSEEHIEPLKYMEVAGVDKVDGKEKRNFVTKRSSVIYTEIEAVTPTQSDVTSPVSQPGKKTASAAGGQLFSYKEFKQTAESKIERELREMREREEELRKQRKEVTGESPR